MDASKEVSSSLLHTMYQQHCLLQQRYFSTFSSHPLGFDPLKKQLLVNQPTLFAFKWATLQSDRSKARPSIVIFLIARFSRDPQNRYLFLIVFHDTLFKHFQNFSFNSHHIFFKILLTILQNSLCFICLSYSLKYYRISNFLPNLTNSTNVTNSPTLL